VINRTRRRNAGHNDVFMMLICEPGKFDPERGALGAFLFGVARNHIMKQLERTPTESNDAGRT